MIRRRVSTAVAMLLCIAAPVLLALDVTASVRGPVGVAFFLLVPGLAFTSCVRVEDPLAEIALVFGVGLALLALAGQAMITFHVWHPAVATDVVAAVSFLVLAASIRPVPAPAVDAPRAGPVGPARITGATDPDGSAREPARAARHDTRSGFVVGNLARRAEVAPVATVVPSPPLERARRFDVKLLAHALLLADAAALWVASLARTHVGGESGIGLVSALPWTYFLAIATLTIGFAWALASPRENTGVLAAYTVLLVLVLHATTAALYPEPRYAWVYKHIGVIRYIDVHGSVNRDVDIYQNWPGFFALAAWFGHVTGWRPTSYAAWAQPAFELLNVAALVFCFRGLTRDRRHVWLAVWVFVAANWLGQDYLSPQAFAFFETLVVVGIVLRCAPRDGPATTALGRSWARVVDRVSMRLGTPSIAGAPVGAPLHPIAALVAGGVCFAAVVISHQLTPFVAVAFVAVLVALRRARPVWLPFVMLAATLAWLAFAWPFVSRHFALFDPGRPGTAHPSGFRAGDALPGVHTVDAAKLVIVVVLVALAAVGLWSSIRSRRGGIVVAALAVTPVAPAALQSYGGEGYLRALLFALPWLAFLAAGACLRVRHHVSARTSWWRLVSIAGAGAVLLPLLLVSYFGQETVAYMARSDVAVNRWYLAHAPAGSVVSFVAGNSPARLDARYASMEVGDGATTVTDLPGMDGRAFRPSDVTRIADLLASQRGTARYLVSSPSQTRFLAYYGVVPRGWVDDLDHALARSARFDLVYRDGAAMVFRLVAPAASAQRRAR
jgi:hypothetical protein